MKYNVTVVADTIRATLTLEPDVAKQLRAKMRKDEISFKEAVNKYLRLGLFFDERELEKTLPPLPKPMRLGLRPGISIDKTGELFEKLDELEGKNRF